MEGEIQVLFLDIDGVLNCDASARYWYVRRHSAFGGASRTPGCMPWCPICVSNFQDLLERSPENLRIVLSSAWRIGRNTLEELQQFFTENEIPSDRLIGRTPPSLSGERGKEIEHWLEHTSNKVSNFVILDDERGGLNRELRRHLVKTDRRTGLTVCHIEKILRMLSPEVSDAR